MNFEGESALNLEIVKDQPDNRTLDNTLLNEAYVSRSDVTNNDTGEIEVSQEEAASPNSEISGETLETNCHIKIDSKSTYRKLEKTARENPVTRKLTVKGTVKGLWYMVKQSIRE